MSNSKGQIRVVAHVGGKDKRILSIGEKANGGLNITLSLANRSYEWGDEQNNSFTQRQTYSVHMSEKWAGNSIHHTLISDRRRTDTYIDTLAVRNGLVEPIYFHVQRNLTPEKADVSIGRKDVRFCIADFNPQRAILHVGIFLGPPNSSVNLVGESEFYERHIVNFKNFSIIILTSYTNCTSSEHGRLFHFSTKPVISDGQAKFTGGFPPSEGYNSDLARNFAISCFMRCHNAAFEIHQMRARDLDFSDGLKNFVEQCFGLGLSRKPLFL